MKKLTRSLLIVFILFISAIYQNAAAQNETPGLTISLSRDFGYGGNGEIQGTFSIHVRQAPDDVQTVSFYIDDVNIGEDTQTPFAIQFSTDNYPAGMRSISAVGYTGTGQKINSNKIDVAFVSADEVGSKMIGTVGPLLIVVFAAVLIGIVVPILLEKRKGSIPLGAQRNYGVLGGTICPKCQRPFAIHPFKLNLLMGALDRCPHCGKWSMIRRLPLEQLRAAEAAELANSPKETPVEFLSPEEKLKKELDDSRYQNL